MARYCGDRNSELLIANARRFKETCLVQGKSLFTNEVVWTGENCNELIINFVNKPDAGNGDFFEKLETQLVTTSANAKVLAAEMLWLMFLCPSNTGPESKRVSIERVFAWSGLQMTPALKDEYLSDHSLTGIGSAGTAYNTGRWRELVYLMRFTAAFLKLNKQEKIDLLSDHLRFSEWLEQLPENESRQLRHMLLFLFFPDFNERIFGNTDRCSILVSLTDITKSQYNKMKCRERDAALLTLRQKFEQKFDTAEIDYYAEPLSTIWKNAGTDAVSHVKESKEDYIVSKQSAISLNQILYGPPGTGKTYHTINEALAIVDPESLQGNLSRAELKSKFDLFVLSGQIVFTTFHQSFSYEDFVEGLRAESENGQLNYKVESGIFKQICERANEGVTETDDPFDQALTIFTDALASHDGLMTLKTITGKEFEVEYSGGSTLLVYPKSNKLLKQGYSASLTLVRQLYRTGSKKGIYNPSYVDGVLRYLKSDCGLKNYLSQSPHSPVKPFVLIIDEINRGNISNIFGELITLIERSKRAGGIESLTVKLPYSKEPFSVPSNLHIIGTMNTADKSLAQVDIALRRRFEFVEMMPKHELLEGIVIDGIDVAKMLKTINQRIELLYDREHTIGHSFFLPLKDDKSIGRLARIFELEILPLLEEYFFEDWERVGQVLGDHFKKANPELKFIKEKFTGTDTEPSVSELMGKDWAQDGIRPYKRNIAVFTNSEAYIGIYDSPQK
ncbi:AAA domain-containing protein [Shewanella sp. Arc9-LZ]|nr:AAA domain-containing protein [Shewanella sp. Arc9-LZ]